MLAGKSPVTEIPFSVTPFPLLLLVPQAAVIDTTSPASNVPSANVKSQPELELNF
ncbi:MAG: hypothetical protein IJ602_00485 [Paludibacteraceae bacterium]|nr:hypothetical protein [Paludibacteraceae bacterium]